MSMDAVTSPESWARRLLALGEAVRAAVTAARGSGAELALPVAQEGGDTIFAVDRHVEPVIERAVAQWPDTCKPVLVVAEGFGRDGRRLFEAKKQAARGYRVMIDPIDGTRNVMYDKRSAWFIAMVAEDRGEATRLDETLAAVMVELPTSKAGWFDVFGATCDGAAWGRRAAVEGGAAHAPLPLQPSRAATLEHGFAQVANFFPGTKVLAAELMERIVEASVGPVTPGAAAVFDDQYITTAGQMVELMMGRDRFCCDLRPLFYDAQMRVGAKKQAAGGAQRGLVCHPYDVAGALVARRAGVILTDGFGRALDAPLDVHSAVHWCGYANERLRECIEPVIQQWLRERGVHPG